MHQIFANYQIRLHKFNKQAQSRHRRQPVCHCDPRHFEQSPLRPYFELALVTDGDKDALYDRVVEHFGLPRQEIFIVDDRTIRGIRYGNAHGHPTVWIKNGKFAGELPNEETGMPTHTITELVQLRDIL